MLSIIPLVAIMVILELAFRPLGYSFLSVLNLGIKAFIIIFGIILIIFSYPEIRKLKKDGRKQMVKLEKMQKKNDKDLAKENKDLIIAKKKAKSLKK